MALRSRPSVLINQAMFQVPMTTIQKRSFRNLTDAEIQSFRDPKLARKILFSKMSLAPKTGFLETSWKFSSNRFLRSLKRDAIEMICCVQLFNGQQPFGGAGLAGRSIQLGDGSLTQINPDTFEPIVIPGGGAGVAGGRSTGQRIAGAATGALSGAATGAGSKILPGWGTAIGAGIGGLGGLFG